LGVGFPDFLAAHGEPCPDGRPRAGRRVVALVVAEAYVVDARTMAVAAMAVTKWYRLCMCVFLNPGVRMPRGAKSRGAEDMKSSPGQEMHCPAAIADDSP
jgi:hypothetical protein